MPTPRQGQSATAILFMLLFVASLAVYGLASTRAARMTGPGQLAANADRVFVSVADELYELAAGGELLSRWPLAQLGLEGIPVDLRVLDNGRLLVAQSRSPRLLACGFAPVACEPVGDDFADQLTPGYRVVADETTGALLFANVDGDRIWRRPAAGTALSPLTEAGALGTADDLLLDGRRLWVADAARHRIVALEEGNDGVWHAGHELATGNDIASPGINRPRKLALGADGELWAVQSSCRGGVAEVLAYDPDRGALARAVLPPAARPTDLAASGDGIIVSDMDAFRLYRVDTASHLVTPFGDAQLLDALRDTQRRKAEYGARMRLALIAMGVFGLLMIAAAIWATPKEKRWTRGNAAPPLTAREARVPPISGVHWLQRNPKADRFLNWAQFAVNAIALLLLALLILLYYILHSLMPAAPRPQDLPAITQVGQLLGLMLITFIAVPLLARLGLRSLRARLGTDGQRVYVRTSDGRQQSFAPEQLAYSGRALLYRDQVFATQTGKRQSLYADGEVETYLAPLLGRATKLGLFDTLRYQLEHRESTLVSSLALLFVVVIYLLATGLWRQF